MTGAASSARPESVLVLGGGSEIGRAIVVALVRDRPARVVLAGPGPATLAATTAAVSAAGATNVAELAWDATDVGAHAPFFDGVFRRFGPLELVVMSVGVLGDQHGDEADPVGAARVLSTNFTGPAAACLAVAGQLRRQGGGTLVVLSSVAGERVRRANFVYGSSKAGLDSFAQGLADSLWGSGVRVLIVRPGYVRTRMTAGTPPKPLAVSPATVADATLAGLDRRAPVVWVPAILGPVSWVARHLPRGLWRRVPV